MSQKVGEIYFDVTLETGTMIEGQRKVNRELDKTSGSLNQFQGKLTAVAGAISAYASALYLIKQSDAFTKMNAQLKLATDSTRELGIAQDEVKRIAREAQVDIGGVAALYAKITNATKEMGTSQKTVGEITRSVALSLKVSGASVQETSSVVQQLGQAFASGTLRGEEFNALADAGPRLMKALADGIGVPIGQLRAMAEAGLLTSAVLANALPKALKDLENEAKQISTISGAFQNLNTELMLFIGQQTTASGSANLVASSIATLASNLDLLASAALGFAAAKLATLLLEAGTAASRKTAAMIESVAAQQASIAAAKAAAAATLAETTAKLESLAASQAALLVSRQEMNAKLAATNVTLAQAAAQAAAAKSAGAQSFALAMLREAERTTAVAQATRSAIMIEMGVLGGQQVAITTAMTAATAANTVAQTASAAAMRMTSVASTAASKALALVGGPIGLITTLLGLGVTAWMMWGNSAKDESKKAADEVEASGREILSSLEKQNAKLRERLALSKAGNVDAAKTGGNEADKLATTLKEINALKAKGAAITGADQIQLAELEGRYRDISAAMAENKRLKGEIQDAGQESKASEWLKKYATDIERVNAELAKAKKELGDAFTPELEQRIRAKIMPDKKAKTADQKFDDAGYLAGLKKNTVEAWDAINSAEAEAVRKSRELLGEKKISVQTHEEALKLIAKGAAKDREELMAKETESSLAEMTKRYQAEIELQKEGQKLIEEATKQSEEYTKTQLERNISLYEANEALRLHNQEIGLTKKELNALELARIDDAIAIQQQAAAQLQGQSGGEAEIERIQRTIELLKNKRSMTADGQEKQLSADFANDLHGDVKTALSNAFRDSKDPIVAFGDALGNVIYTRVANSLADAMLTSNVGTSVMSGLTSLFSFGGGRAYGGPANSGSLYRVNEKGAPEMFTASNGSQYMMPTKSGRVTAADKVGGGGATINITMNTSVGDIASKSDVIKGMRATASQIAAQISRSKNYGGAMS